MNKLRPEMRGGVVGITAGVMALVLYVYSIGPAYWLAKRNTLMFVVAPVAYYPLIKVAGLHSLTRNALTKHLKNWSK